MFWLILTYICRAISDFWCSKGAYSETAGYHAVSSEKSYILPTNRQNRELRLVVISDGET